MPSYTHDVMWLIDKMVEDYSAGRMTSYNTLREDLSEWVDSVEGLLQSLSPAQMQELYVESDTGPDLVSTSPA
jgi:hypothetical protein